MSTTARSFPASPSRGASPRELFLDAPSSRARARPESRARPPARERVRDIVVRVENRRVHARGREERGALNALKARGVRCLELPLVEAVPGDDAEALPDVLTKERWDWVCVTSPEAAKVFLRGYEAAGRPEGVRVAVVGAATGRALAAGAPDALRSKNSSYRRKRRRRRWRESYRANRDH